MEKRQYTNLDNYFYQYGSEYDLHEYEQHIVIMKHMKKFFKKNILEINEGREKKNKVKIHLYEINNFDLNASAIQLDKKSYAVILRSGIFQIIHNEIGQNYEVFEEITKKHYSDLGETIGLYYLFCYIYVIGHELGHIMNGHHSITSSSNISEEEILHNLNSTDKNYDRYNLELDADLYAVSFLIKFIRELLNKNIMLEYMQSMGKNIDHTVFNQLEAILKMTVTSVYIIHNLFAKKHNYKSNYPLPHERTGFMMNMMKGSIYKLINEDKKMTDNILDLQMRSLYELQKKYFLNSFKITSFEELEKDFLKIAKTYLEYQKKIRTYQLKDS